MSNLALAGLISGFGQGIKSGADHLTNAFIQSGLMGEREKYEQARQQLVFAHDDTVQANKQTYDQGVLQQTQDFTAGQNDKARQSSMDIHNLSESGANTRAAATEAGANTRNNANNAASMANTRLGHTLTNEGQASTQRSEDARQKLDLQNKIDVAKIGASKTMEKSTDPATKARIDAQMKNLDIHGDQLKNALDPAEMDTIKADINDTIQNIDQLVGVQPVATPGDIVKDRFGKSPMSKGN